MFDARLRQTKQRFLAPLVGVASPLPPAALTSGGLVLGLAAAVAAADARWGLALVLFLANRLVDGLDGDVARARSDASDHGGYADMVVDTVVYAAIPLGAAAGSDIEHIWPIAALLVASFYVNTITWTYLAALIEKRERHAADKRTTSIVMPPGLVEGAETMVFFVFMLAVPALLDWSMAIMAMAVAVGAADRFVRGHRSLRSLGQTEQRVDA